MPLNSLPPVGARIQTQTSGEAAELKKPTLNAWQPVADTRLPRQVQDEIKSAGMQDGHVMLVGPNEFLVATTKDRALHVYKDDPDDFSAPFRVAGGVLNAAGDFEASRGTAHERAEPTAPVASHAAVVGDTATRNAQTHQPVAGGIAVRLGADTGLMFSDLPKAVQDEVKAHITRHNDLQSMSMSPEKIEFLRAKKADDGFDVTFLSRDWMGQTEETTSRFGKAPPAPAAEPTARGAALTAIDQLPSQARTAIEERLAQMNELESMSMSPKTFTFVSATPLSDGGFSVVLHGAGFFGGGDDSTHKLGADGRFS